MSQDDEGRIGDVQWRAERYGVAVERAHAGVVADFTGPDRQRLRVRLDRDHGGDLDAMLHGAWLMGANAVRGAAVDFHICRICGCSELKACDGGCAWVDDDLCSACAFDVDSPPSPMAARGSPQPPRRSPVKQSHEFKFGLDAQVRVSPNETGAVIGAAIYTYAQASYLVRYVAGDGRQTEAWWTEDALTAVEPVETAA